MLENTYTTDDLVERIGLMRKFYNEKLFTGKESVTLLEVVGGECEEYTLRAIEKWDASFEASQIQPLVVFETLNTVQEDISGIPSVILYVPVRFSSEQIEGFGKWFRENVQPNILLSLHIDPRATGGCGLVWKNMFYDISLKYYIDKQRDVLVNTFNTYTQHVR